MNKNERLSIDNRISAARAVNEHAKTFRLFILDEEKLELEKRIREIEKILGITR